METGEAIQIAELWGFETPRFTVRLALLLESEQYHHPKKQGWLLYHALNIVKMERFSHIPEKAQRNEERWEMLREMFFGDETPNHWNEEN